MAKSHYGVAESLVTMRKVMYKGWLVTGATTTLPLIVSGQRG